MDKDTRACRAGTSPPPIMGGRDTNRSVSLPAPAREKPLESPSFPMERQPYCLAHPWLSWTEESLPDRKLLKLFHLFDLLVRYLGACIGAELIRDGQLAYVVDWFKRPITVVEVHQINLTALHRARPSSATGMFALLQELYPQAEVLDIVKDLLEGRRRFKDVGGRMDDAAATERSAWTSTRAESRWPCSSTTQSPSPALPGPPTSAASLPRERTVPSWCGKPPSGGPWR